MNTVRPILCLAVALVAMAFSGGFGAETQPVAKTLIQNARIFDGQNEKLADGMSVLVEGNKITKIAKSIPAP